jgi:septal ring factor EnvC (AmiA/AmiB activator)
MNDELRYCQARISQIEESLFETQSDLQRKKHVITDQDSKIKSLKEEKITWMSKVSQLEKEMKS